MTMSTIPGLSYRPEIDELDDGTTIKLLSFDLKTYEVPDVHRYGYCRLLSDFEKLFHLGLGPGTSGLLYKVKDTRLNQIVALRKLEMPPSNDSLSVSVIREITIMRSLKHENIVNILGVAVGRSFESTYLILEYCEFDLSIVLDDDKASAMIQEPHIKNVMLQLFNALEYIHFKRIIHRDISCPNIFFTPEGILKIADFGSACMKNDLKMTPTVTCTRWYKAPELLFGATKYTNAVDMWSAGCILAELFLKHPLFRGDTDMMVITLIVQLLGAPSEVTWPDHADLPLFRDYNLPYQPFNNLWKYFSYESQIMLHLLNRLLVYNPDSRASATDCLQHKYFLQPPAACNPSELLPILKVSDELAYF